MTLKTKINLQDIDDILNKRIDSVNDILKSRGFDTDKFMERRELVTGEAIYIQER